MPSIPKAEAREFGGTRLSPGMRSLKYVVNSLHGGRAFGVDEVHPEFLKALVVVGLMVDMPVLHNMKIGDSASSLVYQGGGRPFYKGRLDHGS